MRQIAQQRTVTQAETWINGECTGELQTVLVRMTPNPKPFKKGTALASAFLESECWDPDGGYFYQCGETVVDDEIRLR